MAKAREGRGGTAPAAWRGPWLIHFFRHHLDDDASSSVPAREFLQAHRAIAPRVLAVLRPWPRRRHPRSPAAASGRPCTATWPAVSRAPAPFKEASPEVVGAWRARMPTGDAKRLYRARAGLVELLNAHFKARFGIDRVLVRSLPKVRCVVLLADLTFNLLQHADRLLS